jgi:trehalose-phosphatase
MRYVFDAWTTVQKKLAGKKIFLFLDYDGTLSHIADHPGKAIMPDEIKRILKRLSNKPRFTIAVISGRSLADIRQRVGIRKLIYSGNHGLEIAGPGFRFENSLNHSFKKNLQQIKRKLNLHLKGFKGVVIEDKKLTLSIHYRLVQKGSLNKIKKIVSQITEPYLKADQIGLRKGKMVLEIIPAINWNKGMAVLWLLKKYRQTNSFPVYIGDDITDEDAFRALKKIGLTVLVGRRKRSSAQFFLNNVGEVSRFVQQL